MQKSESNFTLGLFSKFSSEFYYNSPFGSLRKSLVNWNKKGISAGRLKRFPSLIVIILTISLLLNCTVEIPLLRGSTIHTKEEIKKENPIHKIFKSKDIELDRDTLKPLDNVEIKHPENFKDRVLEVTTFLEGDLDPTDNVKITTRIRDYKNGEITYITPSFESIDGKLTYSHSVLQEENEGVFRIRGASKSDVLGKGNLGLHIQQFDTDKEQDNKMLFGKYASFLQTYIEYLYKYNIDIKSEHLKDLETSFVYYGSLSNGENPSLESSYTTDFDKNAPIKDSVYETVTGAEGSEDSTISYGISNKNNDTGGHGFQNLVATAAGKEPLSGLQLRLFETEKFIRGSILGQALSQSNNNNSMTTVDSVGNNSGLGFSDNTTFSKQGNDLLATATELNNLSVGKNAVTKDDVLVVNFSPDNKVLPGLYGKKRFVITSKDGEETPLRDFTQNN